MKRHALVNEHGSRTQWTQQTHLPQGDEIKECVGPPWIKLHPVEEKEVIQRTSGILQLNPTDPLPSRPSPAPSEADGRYLTLQDLKALLPQLVRQILDTIQPPNAPSTADRRSWKRAPKPGSLASRQDAARQAFNAMHPVSESLWRVHIELFDIRR